MNLLKRFTSKIVACPGCNKKLRVPIKIGKTLEITCSGCRRIFQVKFETTKKTYILWAIWIIIIYLVISLSIAHFNRSLPPDGRPIIEDGAKYIDV